MKGESKMKTRKEFKFLAVLLTVVWLFGSGFGIWVPEEREVSEKQIENIEEPMQTNITTEEDETTADIQTEVPKTKKIYEDIVE